MRTIKQSHFDAIFDMQVQRCAEVLKRKTLEYTGDDPDRLSAFKTAAALQSCTPKEALAGMMAKHIVSLYDMCSDTQHEYSLDVWNEKITDSLNYLFLLMAVVKEEMTYPPDRSEGPELLCSERGREEHGFCCPADPAGADDQKHG